MICLNHWTRIWTLIILKKKHRKRKDSINSHHVQTVKRENITATCRIIPHLVCIYNIVIRTQMPWQQHSCTQISSWGNCSTSAYNPADSFHGDSRLLRICITDAAIHKKEDMEKNRGQGAGYHTETNRRHYSTIYSTDWHVSIKTCSGGSKELVWHSGFLKQIGHFKMIYKSNLRSLEVQKSTLHVKDHHGQDLSFSFGCSF